MKKIFLTSFLILFTFLLLHAEEIKINKKDGTNLIIPLEQIQSIEFYQGRLDTLVARMCGSFSSEEQHASNPAFFDIRIKMVRIWHHLPGAYWIYVEQAKHGYESSPYRQRIYKVFIENGELKDYIYELPNPAAYINMWQNPQAFNNLDPSQLIYKPGCDVYFDWDGANFHGETHGTGCASNLNGASYTTTTLWLYTDRMESLDQGWASNGQQVWGSGNPYIFKKIASFPIN